MSSSLETSTMIFLKLRVISLKPVYLVIISSLPSPNQLILSPDVIPASLIIFLLTPLIGSSALVSLRLGFHIIYPYSVSSLQKLVKGIVIVIILRNMTIVKPTSIHSLVMLLIFVLIFMNTMKQLSSILLVPSGRRSMNILKYQNLIGVIQNVISCSIRGYH